MSVRPPSLLSKKPPDPFGGLLDHEIAGEMASALGRAGHHVEKSLKNLHQIEDSSPDRQAALQDAAQAVYAYFIQRELCGFRRHEGVIREYGIPREVLVRLGAN